MSETLTERYASAFAATPADTPKWLMAEREFAFATFQEMGFPTRRDEQWKYTDVSSIANADLTPALGKRNESSDIDLKTIGYGEHHAHELVFIDGRYAPEMSRIGELANGVVIGSVREALEKTPEVIEKRLNSCLPDDGGHVFAALNTAFFDDGAYLHIPDGVVVEHPIILYFIASRHAKRLALHPRNLIVIGEHAEAKVIESFHCETGSSFTNVITEIETYDHAVLEHYKLQHASSFHIGATHLKQRRASRVESMSIALDGVLTRNDLTIRLVGEDARIALYGFYMGDTDQHIDNHTLVEHIAPNTVSDEDYRGVLDGRARGVFNGKVIVHKDAQEIVAAQANANLLLSDDAEIDTKPELEIYADNVQCSHGASIGQLDKDALFYLRSRCMDEATAKNLLTFAFADKVIGGIKSAPVRRRLETIVGGRLPNADLITDNLNTTL